MYDDNASEAPLYLVPNSEGTGKRFVRRPHPPPTTAPLPDDFDAITDTRDGTTVYSDVENSVLAIDYDAVTVAASANAAAAAAAVAYERPATIHAPIPIPPSRNPANPPKQQRRAISPSHTLAGPDARSPPRADGPIYDNLKGPSASKARSVAGDRAQRRSLGAPGNVVPLSSPAPPPFSPGRGPAMGRSELVEKLVFEDGPERTISVWRENVARKGEGGGGGGDREGEGRSEVDSHVGRRKVSTETSVRRRVDSVAQVAGSVKGKGHRSRESAEFTEVPHSSSLQPGLSPRSSTPHANATPPINTSQPTTPQKSQRRPPPTSPTVGPKGTEYSGGSVSDQTKVTSPIESILSSCQPSLVHLLPILEELGVRRSEHMTALARMREETRDREVKEEALKKGITVVEWAILIDKLQSL